MTIKQILINCLLGFVAPLLSAQNTLTLEQAVAMALTQNLDIKKYEQSVVIAHNNNTPGNAGQLPSIQIQANHTPSVTNIKQEFTNGTLIQKQGVQNQSSIAAVQLSYTVFDGAKMYATKNKLNYLDQAAKTQLKMIQQDVVAKVVVQYSQLCQLIHYLKVLKHLDTLSQERLDLVKNRRIAGIANQADEYLAQLQKEEQAIQILSQQRYIDQAYAQLNALMNQPIATQYNVDAEQWQVATMRRSQLDSLLAQNQALAFADVQVQITKATQKETQAGLWPLIKLNGAYNYSLNQSNAGFSLYNQSIGPQAGISLVMPIYSGSNLQHAIKNAQTQVKIAELSKDNALQSVQLTFQQAWLDYELAKTQHVLNTESVKTASAFLSLMQERFKLGQNTLLDLKTAQTTYETAVYRQSINLLALKVAETQLLSLSGSLVQ